METSGKRTACSLNSDIISSLPQNIIESILSLMPLGDAVRTSVLSKKWEYYWRGVPEIVFTNDMIKSSSSTCMELIKYKLVTAIFQVLLFHKGPKRVQFNCSVGLLRMESEFAQMISYLAMRNCVKWLVLVNDNGDHEPYKLSLSFFSLQGLEVMILQDCAFEPPLTFNGFSHLKTLLFWNVVVTTHALERFISKSPLVEDLLLRATEEKDFEGGGNKLPFVDLLPRVPLIKILNISKHYMKYLFAGASPHNLPTSLVHLKFLHLDVCLAEQNLISSAFCLIRSSPVLKKLVFRMYDNEKSHVQQTRTNFLDSENHPDLMLDHLETLKIKNFSSLPFEMEFVKLVMTKSPMLKNVLIVLHADVSVDKELKILRDMLLLSSFPHPSPSVKLSVVRPKTS